MHLGRSLTKTLLLVTGISASVTVCPVKAEAQWVATWRQAHLRAPHNNALAERYSRAFRFLNGVDLQQAALYEALWKKPGGAAFLDSELVTRASRTLTRPPSRTIEAGAAAPEFFRLVPETEEVLRWGYMFRRQVLDVLADPRISANDKDGRIAELVVYYRSRPGLALGSLPKSLSVLDGQFQSFAFRRGYTASNGYVWATRWLEAGFYESLLVGESEGGRASLQAAMINRFQQMIASAPNGAPYVLPLTAVIAPTFARRYPDAAAIVDNLHMLEDAISDVLVARELPKSAKRIEILNQTRLFRSDSGAFATTAEWLQKSASIGANNMGGPAIGFSPELPMPTVARGESMAGRSAPSKDSMPGMQHGGTPSGQNPTMESMQAIFERMMADPVIRERAATDPTLQKMLGALKSVNGSEMGGMGKMPGMGSMPSMTGTLEERERAMEFVVRLLSDPAVEGKIHSDPALHALWSDPEVQKRLKELKSKTSGGLPGKK